MSEEFDINFFVLESLKWILIILFIVFIFYLLLVAYPRSDACEVKCYKFIPEGEKLIDFEVEIFTDLCVCKYSNSIKHFKIKYE